MSTFVRTNEGSVNLDHVAYMRRKPRQKGDMGYYGLYGADHQEIGVMSEYELDKFENLSYIVAHPGTEAVEVWQDDDTGEFHTAFYPVTAFAIKKGSEMMPVIHGDLWDAFERADTVLGWRLPGNDKIVTGCEIYDNIDAFTTARVKEIPEAKTRRERYRQEAIAQQAAEEAKKIA